VEMTACSTLHSDSFEEFLILKEKTKQILIAHQKKVVDGKKSTPRSNKKGPLPGVSKHKSNM
jgi:hypothetical protein